MTPPLRGPLTWILAWRFLRGRRTRLLQGTARAALVAIGVGVTAMVIAMALMTGYRNDLRRKLVGDNAGVTAIPLGWPERQASPRALAALAGIEGVSAVREVAYAQGSLASERELQGLEVTVRGVDPGEDAFGVSTDGLAGEGGGSGVLLGAELASRLELRRGDPARLMIVALAAGQPAFHYRAVRVQGTFRTGFSEFDRGLVVVNRRLLETVLGPRSGATLYELAVEDLDATPRISAAAKAILGSDFLVSDWQDLNRELFTALALQQRALFFVLGLIVLVSTFNVASTLVVLVRERRREIGALFALGLPRETVRIVFLLYGGGLGLAGTAAGALVGGSLAWALDAFHLIRFGPEVAAIYFLSAVPFQLRWPDLAAVVAFSLAVTLLASWFPARRAARIDPSAALRYE